MKHPWFLIALVAATAVAAGIPWLGAQEDADRAPEGKAAEEAAARVPAEPAAASERQNMHAHGAKPARGRAGKRESVPPVADPDRAWMGIAVDELDALAFAQLDLAPGIGLAVIDLAPGGPAEKAGLRRHDILLALHEEPLMSRPQFFAEVAAWQPGDRVALDLLRDNRHRSVHVIMGRPGDTYWKDWAENLPAFKASAELDAMFSAHEERFEELKADLEALEAEDSPNDENRERTPEPEE